MDSFRSIGTYRPANGVSEKETDSPHLTTTDGDAGADTASSDVIELEEQRHEGYDALGALIASKMASSSEPSDTDPWKAREETTWDSSPIGIPTAKNNLKLTGKQCLDALTEHRVPFVRPAFETPNIQTPVLLSGPIGEVRIGPKYSGGKRPTNAVMDCHLALALVEVARYAASLGISAVEFYSTYRPLKKPPKTCPKKGKGRKKCLKKKRNYERTLRQQTSQHRFGRAIDIRWLKTTDDRTLDVLEHFDRRSGTDPCSYLPRTEEAKLLADFACGIHRRRIFNVMLTPNANKAHHNHFHFDLTPNAGWYIIR